MYKLLIVEDEPLIRRGMMTLINFESLKIGNCYEAEDGQQGLELYMAHSPQLVLLDINLPLMNGIELAERIKSHNPSTKIAMITGYDYFDYAVSALRIGVDEFVLKPVSKIDISNILFKLIEKYEAEVTREALSDTVISALKQNSLATDQGMNGAYRSQIQAALDQELFNPDFSLTALASQLNLSPSYLSSLFKTTFGIPFQDFVLQKRLERAKLLLLTSPLKIYEIAETVGFEDVNYFSTRFKKTYGVSPKQFVQNVRQAHDQVPPMETKNF